jgi:hypothetical protein
VRTFLTQALKSSQGEEDWLRFFALMGSALAIREKSDALVPDTPTQKSALVRELRQLAKKLNVERALRMYGQALQVGRHGEGKGNHFFLLKLDPARAL